MSAEENIESTRQLREMFQDKFPTVKFPDQGKDKYEGTPNHYAGTQGDVYDFLIAQYGVQKWTEHALMEVVQYLLRSKRKGHFREDIQKSVVILQRILRENSEQAPLTPS